MTSVSSTRRSVKRAAIYAAVAVMVCAGMALRAAAARMAEQGLSASFMLDSLQQDFLWVAAVYASWAILTPLIFVTARRFPFSRSTWVRALVFHLPVSVIATVVSRVALAILFGGLVLGHGWPPGPTHLLRPFWIHYMLARAITETWFYWVILGAGHVVMWRDEAEARRVQEAELARAITAAQVDALTMKLQPHFLFNTLNSINFLALERDTTALVTMVERLGNLLRASIRSTGSHLVPLEEELALLDQYLAIEEVRFRDRLRVERHIDPSAAGALIPSLVLQPIVENSIKHGFARRLAASRLELTIRADQDMLSIMITDDGPGLAPGWDPATHCGRGLRNVMDRLHAIYGDRWSFVLRNATPTGTVAELRVPRRERPPASPQPA
jgi:two-component system, LytTR family, sensor kinase